MSSRESAAPTEGKKRAYHKRKASAGETPKPNYIGVTLNRMLEEKLVSNPRADIAYSELGAAKESEDEGQIDDARKALKMALVSAGVSSQTAEAMVHLADKELTELLKIDPADFKTRMPTPRNQIINRTK